MYPTKAYDTWSHRQAQALRHARVQSDAAADGGHVGCFGWCMFDYPTHKDFGSGDRVCYHGVMDAFRNPKPAAALYASQGEGATVLTACTPMDIGDYPGGQIGDSAVLTLSLIHIYFCDSLGENYSVGLQIREPAGQTVLEADRELLTRALDNLLNNSVRHNPGGCDIQVAAELENGRFVLTVRDNGAGYPEAVLRNLSGTDDPNAPHILGLHLVQQIAAAHEGEASFCNDGGAVATLKFAVQESTK